MEQNDKEILDLFNRITDGEERDRLLRQYPQLEQLVNQEERRIEGATTGEKSRGTSRQKKSSRVWD